MSAAMYGWMLLLGLAAILATAWAGPLVACFAVPPSVALGMVYGQRIGAAPAPAGRDDGGADT